MTIWAYETPCKDSTTQTRYGCPVQVYLPGKGWTKVVYQFGTPSQQCAVVHHASGQIIAPIQDHHKGYPEQRAQAACEERFKDLPWHFARRENQDAYVARIIDAAPRINGVARIVGILKRWPA